MKKFLIALLVSAPLIASAGSGKKSHDDYQERYLQHIQKNLSLTEAQTKEINQIFNEHRDEMRALRERTQSRVDAILDSSQREAMADMRENRRDHWEKRKGKHEHGEGRREGREHKKQRKADHAE
ncbi:MAG: hypothetical protein CVV10_01080 [Gammaproteobacteria bacterium HGW-Gammaproteobacteria-14]|nr:MAG: hypothetical protein CVV10_01080 [Gammaproteobacteria bacterium HGW-Gammaproteobacteria-14]